LLQHQCQRNITNLFKATNYPQLASRAQHQLQITTIQSIDGTHIFYFHTNSTRKQKQNYKATNFQAISKINFKHLSTSHFKQKLKLDLFTDSSACSFFHLL